MGQSTNRLGLGRTMETFYIKNECGLYLSNPDNSTKLVLETPDFSPNQTWKWTENMLQCGTGKVLDINGKDEIGPGAQVLAWKPHGRSNQQFYFYNLGEDKFFIGALAVRYEKQAFFSLVKDGEPSLDTASSILPNFTWKKIPALVDIKPPFTWVTMESNVLPPNALAAGKDQSDTFNVFVGCYGYDKETFAGFGKVHNGNRYIDHGGTERRATSEHFVVLCVEPGAKVEWAEYKEGTLPQGAVKGGDKDGKSYYVGRGIVQGQITPGMFVPGKMASLCALYGGRVHKLKTFEILTICNTDEKKAMICKKAASKPYKWKFMDSDFLPENAFPAGKDHSESLNVYVGRYAKDDETFAGIGKVHNSNRYVGYGNDERSATSEKFSVLCVDPKAEVDWIDYEYGKLPENAVEGGIVDGQTQYVGRGTVENQLIPGMFVPIPMASLLVLYGGKVHQVKQFQVLTVKRKMPFTWKLMDSNYVPEHALPAGKDHSDTFNVFVGRHENDDQSFAGIGKVHNGNRYIGNGTEKKVTTEKFSILCVDPEIEVEWVPYEEGDLPPNAVPGGAGGETVYVGRGLIKGQLTPGMFRITPGPGTELAVLYGGGVHHIRTFEVLTFKDRANEF